jgi:hypothetical protein
MIKTGGEIKLHQDWFMRQLDVMSTAIGNLVFNKNTSIFHEVRDELKQVETDILYLQLCALLNDDKINEAEDLLFEKINPHDSNHQIIVVDFYEKIGKMTSDELEKQDYSKEEMAHGLNEMKRLFVEQIP